jgi:CRP-like cAMP-binding protein
MQDPLLIHKVITICNKKPNERLPSEISTLVELTKTCKIFKSLIEENGKASHVQCCKYLQYYFGQQGEYVFRYGEKGSKFYVIISGLVAVEIPKKSARGDTIFTEAITLATGASFGDLALESSKPRAASIKCKEDSHFIFLEKQDYVSLIAKLVQDKRDASVNFLQSLPMFNTCTKGTLTKLTYAFKEKNFNKGQIVYNEGDKADDVFLVKKGEFEFFKIIKKQRKEKNVLIYKEKFKHCKIANYGIGEIFGEEDAFRMLPRANTCKSVSNNSLVLVILKNVKKT